MFISVTLPVLWSVYRNFAPSILNRPFGVIMVINWIKEKMLVVSKAIVLVSEPTSKQKVTSHLNILVSVIY
jgi:hypothetical protein